MKERRLEEAGKIEKLSWRKKILRQLVEHRWFALADLFLVMISAVVWMLIPQFGIGFSLIALLPWVIRYMAGKLPLQRTAIDWLIAIFLVTAWVGYWAAFDKPTAWIKVWLIITAVLLYYALSAQPKQNGSLLSFLSFCFALGLSLYFCLTYDFTGSVGGFGSWWMNFRPQVGWPAIHYDDVLGIILISAILAFYWLWNTSASSFGSLSVLMRLFLIVGMGIVALVFALTLSRGLGLIGVCVAGLWALWKVSTLSVSNSFVKAAFPVLVFGYLVVLIAFAYFGPASEASESKHSKYGANSRAEVLGRSANFLVDYPITGAGLGSFAGLYSQYMLVIPFFYFANSYNLFLDVAIEQGIAAGSILIILYISGVFRLSRSIVNEPQNELRLLRWLGLFALIVTIVHGIFYDYLYSGNGAALLFFPLGMAMMGVAHQENSRDDDIPLPKASPRINLAMIALPIVALTLMFGANANNAFSYWYSNLGAVQMSKAELEGFPSDKWATSDMVHRLEAAESTLQTALQYDSNNQTANHRLGLISMLRQDFITAARNLEAAHQEAPNHRGIIKSLGYCYVWLGEIDNALPLLAQIPEAYGELKVYIWWWDTQERPDLSENASIAVLQLDSISP